jgi:RNA polymerase sigma-70 factor (ECF subfamily)
MRRAEPQSPKPEADDARSVVRASHAANDAALVKGLLADDALAKAAFFERYAPAVERLITRLIGFDRELPDILQEVFLHALVSIHGLRDPAALKPWLLSIATRCARRTLRSRARRGWLHLFADADEEALHEPAARSSDPEAAETVRAVYTLLRAMRADDRIVFALRYIDGMDLAEVATAVSVSVATVKRRLRRSEKRFLRSACKHPLLEGWVGESSRWRAPQNT